MMRYTHKYPGFHVSVSITLADVFKHGTNQDETFQLRATVEDSARFSVPDGVSAHECRPTLEVGSPISDHPEGSSCRPFDFIGTEYQGNLLCNFE